MRLPVAAFRQELARDLLIPEPDGTPHRAVAQGAATGRDARSALGRAQIIAINRNVSAVAILAPAPVLGVSWDGTGHGRDGTVWGGEFFLLTEKACRRAAHFRQFRLPGGEQAVKEPRRAVLGMLYEVFGESALAARRTAADPSLLPRPIWPV